MSASAAEIVLEHVRREDLLSPSLRAFLLQNELPHNLALTALNNFVADPLKQFFYCSTLSIQRAPKSDEKETLGFVIFFDHLGRKFLTIAISPTLGEKSLLETCARLIVDDLEAATKKGLVLDFASMNFDHFPFFEVFEKIYNTKATIFGATLKPNHVLNLYQLLEKDLKVSPLPNGFSFRCATMEDFDVLWVFLKKFGEDIDEPDTDDERPKSMAKLGIQNKTRFLLFNEKNEAVSLAGFRLVSDTVRSVGPVFTPVNERKKGYAKIVTSQLCHVLLGIEGVKRLMLFADFDNTTTNKLYSEIGFTLVGKCLMAEPQPLS